MGGGKEEKKKEHHYIAVNIESSKVLQSPCTKLLLLMSRGRATVTDHSGTLFCFLSIDFLRAKEDRACSLGFFSPPCSNLSDTLKYSTAHFTPRCHYSNVALCGPRLSEDAALKEQN